MAEHPPVSTAVLCVVERDVVRLTRADVGLEVVTQVASDETWSALRAKIV
jgi:hypothetical protein